MSAYRKYAKLPGFRDFPPEELAFRNHIFDAWRGVAGRYGYQEYDGPPLEELELYTDKSGSEIAGQLYEFTDKGARRVALRPEMTPSLARILAGRSRALRKPIRWFSIPQLFRYERQQRGRLREHFQWNVDLVGESGTGADAEVLAVAIDGLRELGLGAADIRARVSDRILLSRVFAALDVPPARTPGVFAALDRIERESVDRIRERLAGPGGSGLGRERADAVLGFFSDPTIGRIERDFAGSPRVAERAAELRRYESVLGDLGFADFVEFDFSIVRGLAYYTGIVFEIFDRAGRFRAICGGGRYDRLMEHVGGDRLSAVGFGMGDVVLGEVVRARGLPPEYRPGVDYYIISISPAEAALARRIAGVQRREGRSVVYALGGKSVKKQFSSAAALGAGSVIVLGPDEVERGVAVVKEMASGQEREIPIAELTHPARGGSPSETLRAS